MSKQLSCGVEFMRAVLLLLNIIFVFIGLGLIGLGIYAKVDNNLAAVLTKLTNVSSFEGQSLGFLAFVLIGGGVFILLVAFFGCMGSLRHNRCLLHTYAFILAMLMILQVTGFIMVFVYKGKLENVYKESLKNVFVNALNTNDTKVLNAFHDLEETVKCCGINGIQDYTSAHKDAPASCYRYVEGCSAVIIRTLEKNLPLIGGVLGGVVVVELIAFIGALVLAVALKHAPETVYSSNPSEVISHIVPGRRRNYNQFA